MEFTQSGFPGRLLSTLGLPAVLVAKLKHAGYENTSDLAGTSQAELEKELGVGQTLPVTLIACLPGQTHSGGFAVPQEPALKSVPASQILSQSLASSHRPSNSTLAGPDLTSASALLAKPRTYSTPCLKLNSMLSSGTPIPKLRTTLTPPSETGLRSLYILEICGPPGSGKACLALEFIRSAAKHQETVLVADCQSAMTPGRIHDALSMDSDLDDENHPSKLVLRTRLPTLTHLIAFIRTLPKYLEEKKAIQLIVFSSLSFVFQPTEYFALSSSEKTRILGTIKQALTKACLENGVTIVITSQTATKLVKPDGSVANFETGSKAILASQLGNSLFTASRSYRLMLSRDMLGVRHAQLIASPNMPSPNDSKPASRTSTGGDADTTRVGFMIDHEGRVRDV